MLLRGIFTQLGKKIENHDEIPPWQILFVHV